MPVFQAPMRDITVHNKGTQFTILFVLLKKNFSYALCIRIGALLEELNYNKSTYSDGVAATVCSDAGSWRTCLVVLLLRRALRPNQRSLAYAALPTPKQQQSIIVLYSVNKMQLNTSHIIL